MCGICGVFSPDPAARIDRGRVAAMMAQMARRGPDAEGFAEGAGYALGHRRLSIIDLSDDARQPMRNEDGTVHVVFNGEIYNFGELRQHLERDGHRFSSHSDTEVLVHGYESWGIEELLRKLRGMYAFAVIDTVRHCVHLARDPVGKKPLVFHYDQKELVFASTVRALIRGLGKTPRIDGDSVDRLLSGLYIPGPETILKNVEKLPPGQAVSIGRDGEKKKLIHWAPNFMDSEERVSDQEWLQRIEQGLETAIKRRLVADVPVGILLSGGMDSSLVTAIASRISKPIATFSVAADDPELDESEFAEAVARKYGTVHRVLPVKSDLRDQLVPFIAEMGEPLADASMIQVYAIARLARESVSVVLTGDGGDELFGGYKHFLAYHLADRIRKFCPASVLNWLRPLPALLPGGLRKTGTVLRFATMPPAETFHPNGWFSASMRTALYRPEFRRAMASDDPYGHYRQALPSAGDRFADQVMQAHFQTVLADDYLVKIDNGTMAASLEARCPFLDLDLVEMAMRIPAPARFRGCRSKSLLRRLALRHLPVQCVKRPKRGFVTPVGKWLRGGWTQLLEPLLLSRTSAIRDWFDPAVIRQIIEEHRAGAERGYALWTLLVLEVWIRVHLAGTLRPDECL